MNQPFANLAALQAGHAALAGVAHAPGAALAHADLVRDFVARAVDTGRTLETRDDRRAAQALVNYWVSRSASESRKAEAGAAPPVLAADFDTLLAEYDPATATTAVAAADAALSEVGADPALVRRVLTRLIRLHPDGPEFDASPASRASLRDLPKADEASVDAIVQALVDAGVVTVTPGPTPAADYIALKPAVLAAGWKPLLDAQAERRAFRARTAEFATTGSPSPLWRLFDAGGDFLEALGRVIATVSFKAAGWLGVRPNAERLDADEQDDAEEYGDLNEAEVKFLRAGRALQRRLIQINRGLATLMLVAVAAAFASAVFAREEALRATAEAQRATHEEETAWDFAALAEQSSKEAEQAADQAAANEAVAQDRLRLTCLRLVVRAHADVANARGEAERKVAGELWRAVTSDHTLQQTLQVKLEPFHDQALAISSGAALARPVGLTEPLADVRDEIVCCGEARQTLEAAREVAYEMVELCVKSATQQLEEGASYAEIEPFARAFWSQYSGETLLVERNKVRRAMVQFGNSLDAVRKVSEDSAGASANATPLTKDFSERNPAVQASQLKLVLKAIEQQRPAKPLRDELREAADALLKALKAERGGPLAGEPPLDD